MSPYEKAGQDEPQLSSCPYGLLHGYSQETVTVAVSVSVEVSPDGLI